MQDIPNLKKAQNARAAQEQELIAVVRPFINELLNELDQFTKDAIHSQLHGVKPLSRVRDDENFLEATLSLNGQDLVIASNFRVSLANKTSRVLASKILIYSFRFQDEPAIAITIQKQGDTTYGYSMMLNTKNGWEPITGSPQGRRGSGTEAADQLISFFYDLKDVWKEKPSLLALREGETRELGFPTPK